MKENETYHPIDLLKEAPTEVGRERVEKMISAFPIVPPPTDWSSFINLNSILMTSIGAIIIAGTIGFFSGESTANTTETRQYQIDHQTNEAEEAKKEASTATLPIDSSEACLPLDQQEVSAPEPPDAIRQAEIPEPVAALGPDLPDSADPHPPMAERDLPPLPPTIDMDESKRTFDLSGFTGVKLAGSHDVSVQKGAFSVTANGDETRLDKLEIEVRGNTLHITSKNENWNDTKGKGSVTIEVHVPTIDHLSLAGSGNMDVGGFSGLSSLELNLSGSGNLTVEGDLEVSGDMDISLAGSGDMKLKGSAKSVDIGLAGSGDIEAKDLSSKTADVSIAGSGDVTISCSDELDASIAGSGDVHYYGSPKVSESVRGSGDVRGH